MPALRLLPLELIDAPGVVLRASVDDLAVRELAASIASLGLLQPIGVVEVGARFRLVFGHTRLLAHRWLGRPMIEAKVLGTEEAAELESSAAENVQRRDLSPVEEARAIRAMIEGRGRSVREVAAAMGKSESWVRLRLEVLLFPPEVVELVARGEVSVSVARELVMVEEDAVRAVYLRCAVENGVTAGTARQWRQEWEARRALGATPGDGVAVPASVAPPAVPVVACVLCEQVMPVTAVAFVKACPACYTALLQAKHATP